MDPWLDPIQLFWFPLGRNPTTAPLTHWSLEAASHLHNFNITGAITSGKQDCLSLEVTIRKTRMRKHLHIPTSHFRVAINLEWPQHQKPSGSGGSSHTHLSSSVPPLAQGFRFLPTEAELVLWFLSGLLPAPGRGSVQTGCCFRDTGCNLAGKAPRGEWQPLSACLLRGGISSVRTHRQHWLSERGRQYAKVKRKSLPTLLKPVVFTVKSVSKPKAIQVVTKSKQLQ